MLAKCGLPPELSGCQQHPLASHVGCVDPTIPQSILLPAATDAQVGSVAVATDRVATNMATNRAVRIGHKEGLSESRTSEYTFPQILDLLGTLWVKKVYSTAQSLVSLKGKFSL